MANEGAMPRHILLRWTRLRVRVINVLRQHHVPLSVVPTRMSDDSRVIVVEAKSCAASVLTFIRMLLSEVHLAGGVPRPASGALPQRRRAPKPSHEATFDIQSGECTTSDEDNEEAEAGRDEVMGDTYDQPRSDERVMIARQRHSQQPDGSIRVIAVDPEQLQTSEPLPPYSKLARPTANRGEPLVTQSHAHANMQQLPHNYIDIPQLASPTTDTQFFGDLDLMDNNFDGTEGIDWSHQSLLDGTTLDSLSRGPGSDLDAGDLKSHQSIGQYGLATNGERLAVPDAAMGDEMDPTIMLTPSSLIISQEEQAHVDLARRLMQLTTTLLQDLNAENECKRLTDREADASENRGSPISRLLCNVECFLGILSDVSKSIRQSYPSPKDALDNIKTTLGHTDRNLESCKQQLANSKQPPRPPSCGLPGLTTMMAIIAAYSSVLQVYEQVFNRIQLSLLSRTGNTGRKMSLPLLPLFQLDNVRLGTQNNLHVHIAMDVSLQMLKQIESRLSDVLEAYGGRCESYETRACLTALLQSLTCDGGADSMSVSGMIRDTINMVRKLFTSEGKLA
ncbi:hypothetical protein PT974_04458 [Cladobotryum mycophilum]|uniref:Uncharacterized protein n=1 Tax=Cladobotryum mycophilum TaxID=491253 RepID=A0ABR0SW89_9HYPO